jgi:hypothetical protein
MTGAGTTTINAAVELKIDGTVTLKDRSLENRGNINWASGNIQTDNVFIDVMPTGKMFARSAGEIKYVGNQASPTEV